MTRRIKCAACGHVADDPEEHHRHLAAAPHRDLGEAYIREGQGRLVTDGGRDLVDACPECDSCQLTVRVSRVGELPHRAGGDERFHCRDCGALFDDPHRREPRASPPRTGLAGRLDEADDFEDLFEEGRLVTDGGVDVDADRIAARAKRASLDPAQVDLAGKWFGRTALGQNVAADGGDGE